MVYAEGIPPPWQRSIEDALDRSDWAEAAKLARKATREAPDAPEAHGLLSEALENSGDLPGAAEAMARAVRLAPDDAVYAADHAWLLFELGRFREAKREADRSLALDLDEPLAHHVLAWLADRKGDRKAMRQHDEAAFEIDPEGFPLPIEIAEKTCREAVASAFEAIPEAHRRLLDVLPVVLEPHPEPWMLEGGDLTASVLGAYIGTSLSEISVHSPPEMPPTVYVFIRCIARSCRDEDHAREELRRTVLHEIAHHLGFGEEEMERLGLA